MLAGSVWSVPVRRLTVCKYIQEGFFRLFADDFPRYRNDSYLHVKYRKRMPQLVGRYAVSLGWITTYFLFFFFTKKDIRC